MKYYFGTFPRATTFGNPLPPPGTPVPFPDPDGTYWGVRHVLYHRPSPAPDELQVWFTKPGFYTLYLSKTPPIGTMQTYRRRGLDIDGAAGWTEPGLWSSLGQDTEPGNIIRYDISLFYPSFQQDHCFFWFFKRTGGPFDLARGHQLIRGINLHWEFGLPIFGKGGVGGAMAWPQNLWASWHLWQIGRGIDDAVAFTPPWYLQLNGLNS